MYLHYEKDKKYKINIDYLIDHSCSGHNNLFDKIYLSWFFFLEEIKP